MGWVRGVGRVGIAALMASGGPRIYTSTYVKRGAAERILLLAFGKGGGGCLTYLSIRFCKW